MRCPTDNNIMLDPQCIFEDKEMKKLLVLIYKCDKCESRWCFMCKDHPDYGKGNELQEFTKDGKIIMRSGINGSISQNQERQFMYRNGG